MQKKGKHITCEKRKELEVIATKNNKLPLNEKSSQRKIALRMGVSVATISHKLRKGKVI